MLSSRLKIVSGGQTGVDRAALDLALENGFATGGFVPRGRVAEDGAIPDKYPGLTETTTSDPAERTELNVLHSDATLILSHGTLTGGAHLTRHLAVKHNKPVLHVDLLNPDIDGLVRQLVVWLARIDCSILNIAGPRASEDRDIYDDARSFLGRSLLP